MPTSKSSTSSLDAHALSYRSIVHERLDQKDYRWLLGELLAVIHRDGGHYTAIAGEEVSFLDAMEHIPELYRRNAALAARVGQLARGER